MLKGVKENIFNISPPFYYIANNFIPRDDLKFLDDLNNKSDLYRMPGWNGMSGYNLFIGYETYTNSHLHFFQDFLVNVINGKKIFYMWHVNDNKFLHDEKYHQGHYNEISFWDRDHSKMKIYKVELNGGDSLILPPWWYHAVYTPGFCIMVAKIYNKRHSPIQFYKSEYDINYLIKNITNIYKLNNKKIKKKKYGYTKYIIIFIIICVILFLLKNYD